MNYRTATLEQLRAERVRLTNLQQVLQQRMASSNSSRGGPNAGFRTAATTHQQQREIQRLIDQIARLDAELVWRDRQAQPQAPATAADEPAT